MHGLAHALGLGVSPTATASIRSLARFRLLSPPSRSIAKRTLASKTLIQPSVLYLSRTGSRNSSLEHRCISARRLETQPFSTWTILKMASNGDINHKRKTSPVNINQRPPKHLKPELANILNGDTSPTPTTTSEEQDVYMGEDEGPADVALPPITAMADTAEWQATIEQVVKNVVSIHFCQTCSFDTDPAMSSEATGFVVDAKRGYILTNRHVVGSGPFWGYCIFDNHEEVRLRCRSS